MHKPEFVLKNETHKINWDFDIPTNHLISTLKSNLELINKNKKKKELAVLWILLCWWTIE